MVSNSTIETINYVKDIDFDYNIKFTLICVYLIYAIVLLFLDKKVFTPDNRASFLMMSLGAKVFYWPYFIFFATLITQLSRTQDIGFLLAYQLYFYMIYAVYAGIVLAIYLFEKLFKDWLGWEITMDGLKLNIVKNDLKGNKK